MQHAKKHDLFIELRHRPGDFVSVPQVLARITPQAHAGQEVLDTLRDAITMRRPRVNSWRG